MNIQIIIIEIAVMLAIFTALTLGLLLINPLTFISDYPPEIQERYYKTQNKTADKQRLTVLMKVKKLLAVIAFVFLFAWMLHIAGAKSFYEGVLLSYLYMLCLFVWDTFFLDWVLFANIKCIRLPGTEHMEKEYHQKWFHIKVCLPIVPFAILMGLLSSVLMLCFW